MLLDFSSFNKLRWLQIGILGLVSVSLLIGLFILKEPVGNQIRLTKSDSDTQSPLAEASATTVIPTPSPTPSPTITPIPKPANKIIFGIGSQAGPAMDFRLVKESPVHMLTSWYNGPSDLEWMRVQQNDLIPRLYASKYIVHLITWTDLPEEEIQTPYGSACGRPYPVSSQVVEDMKQLAQIYNGPGPMYVTLFTEFQTYTCTDNNWNGNENYFKALMDNFRKIKDGFRQNAPNSKVAISWGSWSNRYDDAENQGGRSLFAHFADVLKESDFTAFQVMESDTNAQDILAMTKILGGYKKPVMVAHYKPSSGSHEVFDADMRQLFTDDFMHQLTQNGLFAFSFMDSELIDENETSYQIVKNGIGKYGK